MTHHSKIKAYQVSVTWHLTLRLFKRLNLTLECPKNWHHDNKLELNIKNLRFSTKFNFNSKSLHFLLTTKNRARKSGRFFDIKEKVHYASLRQFFLTFSSSLFYCRIKKFPISSTIQEKKMQCQFFQ